MLFSDPTRCSFVRSERGAHAHRRGFLERSVKIVAEILEDVLVALERR